MTTTEKLNAVADKCRANLALAAKRTPGEWIHDKSRESIGDVTTEDLDCIAQAQERTSEAGRGRAAQNIMRDKNAAYIAVCAGAAEAGWRTTLAAIDALADTGEADAEVLAANIIRAWDGLL
jgi:hypothetical protein